MARNRVEIDLGLIRQNFRIIQSAVSPLETMAVLKADGYGLGSVAIREALKKEGCRKFGVADSIEAQALHDGESDIHILGDILPEEIPEIVAGNFIIPITSYENGLLVDGEAAKQGRKARVQLKIDTGMGRLGILAKDAMAVIPKIAQLPHLQLVGIYSHFPHAYEDKEFSGNQVKVFIDILEKCKSQGIYFKEVHIANSDGIHNISTALRTPFNIARTGINLYGCFDLEGERTLVLSPAIRLISRLVAIRKMPKGHSIGYGKSYVLPEDKLIGTVAIGYADGLPRSLSNSGAFIIRGVRCPIVGRVSMDYTTVDVSKLAKVGIGDEVVCLGDEIPVSEWAESAKTITYDIICSIGNRVKRIYLN